MNEEPTSTASGDDRFKDGTQSTRSSNSMNDMVSSGETSAVSENGNDEFGETHGGQEAYRISNISSGGNVTVTTNPSKEGSAKEVEIRNSNRTPRSHFTRSRIQKSSNPQKINSEEEEPKLVSFRFYHAYTSTDALTRHHCCIRVQCKRYHKYCTSIDIIIHIHINRLDLRYM